MTRSRTMLATVALALIASTLSGCGYNRLVGLREAIDGAWAQVENQLQRRNDLIPNLIEVTKGYAAHEKEIFEAVANARARMLAAGGSRDAEIAASGELSSALSRLLALAENYPNLKADTQFARLSDELAGTENRIATERRRYNEVVQEYNTLAKSFPTVLTAKAFGFGEQKYFEAPESAKQVPQVKF
ncbi:MAG: LemA family protein [Deltaproteobacteria bacterium]|nr:LemA family protein [Deltaproteobacteria bacterium]